MLAIDSAPSVISTSCISATAAPMPKRISKRSAMYVAMTSVAARTASVASRQRSFPTLGPTVSTRSTS